MDTSRVRLLPTGASIMPLKLPFSSLYHCSELSGPETFPWCHSLHGLSYPGVSGSKTVDALAWRRTVLATPSLGDALSWRRLGLATPDAVNLLTPFFGPFEWSHHMLTLALTLTLVNARGRDGTIDKIV